MPRTPTSLPARLVFLFAFLGPLGNLIPTPGLPASFRFYYLLLAPAVLLQLYKGVPRKTFNSILLTSPVLFYMLLSSLWFYIAYGNVFEGGEEGNPLFRLALLMLLFFFTVFAGTEASSFSLEGQVEVVVTFLRGYLVSLFIGYLFFLGFYGRLLSLQVIARFEILVQFGFGLLRFSPGSYPNEYGIVSSFSLTVVTLLLLHRKAFVSFNSFFFPISSRTFLICCFLSTLGALFLATTRAAYIAYLISLLWITLSQGSLRKIAAFSAKLLGVIALILFVIEPFFNVVGIIVAGYDAFFDPRRPASGRFDAWTIAYSLFLAHPILGAGFGSVDMMHNVYLQLFFGLGILGFSLLFCTAVFLFVRVLPSTRNLHKRDAVTDLDRFLRQVRAVALLHILWFAFSNHNLNHFLTWFSILISIMVASRNGSKQRLVLVST